MATGNTTSGSTGFSSSIVDFFIKKRILEHGTSQYRFRKAAEKNVIPAGNGTNIKFVRYNRLVLPSDLTEGVAPTADQLEVETVTGTCKQRGQVVKISDVLELTMWHPVVKHAMEELAEGAARKDDQIIQDVLLGGTQVKYPDTATDRLTLDSGDKLDTDTLREAIEILDMGADGVDGGARTYSDGFYLGILNRKCMLDLMDDTIWQTMAQQQDKSALEKGEILKWSKCKFLSTNFGPAFANSNDLAVAGAQNTSGDYSTSAVVSWGVTRINAKRGFEETIDVDHNPDQGDPIGVGTTLTGSNTGFILDLSIATGVGEAGYLYNVYSAAEAAGVGVPVLLHENVSPADVGAATTQISRGTGTQTMPEAPQDGMTVYTNYILGANSFSVVDLSSLKTIVAKGPDKNDPLDQLRTVGTKFFDTALILNNAFLCRIEAVSAY